MNSVKLQDTKSTYKNQLCFYTLIMNYLEKIKKIIQFPIASKTIKYLGMNLTKELKDLDTSNYKTFLKEIKEDINEWKYIPCS